MSAGNEGHFGGNRSSEYFIDVGFPYDEYLNMTKQHNQQVPYLQATPLLKIHLNVFLIALFFIQANATVSQKSLWTANRVAGVGWLLCTAAESLRAFVERKFANVCNNFFLLRENRKCLGF